ncbi:MAG: serine/threonine protein kinase, partial [Planctomycetes bacterium]|nr:serine/threonine protein kinase [Planctomycetota bacterium]
MDNETADNEFQNMQLGEIAIKLGYISRNALNSVLQELESSSNADAQFLIGEILIQKKLLNKKQLKHVLSLQNRKMLRCTECRKKFSIKNFNPDKKYKCPHCTNPLVLQDKSSQRNRAQKKQSNRQQKTNPMNADMQSQDGDMIMSSNIDDIARQAFSITEEPYDRYSEFMRSFSDDVEEETREVKEIIDTKSEEIVVIDEDSETPDFEAEFSIIDSDDYYGKTVKKRQESSVAIVDDSFVIGSSANFDQSGISVLKMLEEERGIHANIELSTDPQTERHLKKLKRINSVSKYIVYDEVGRGGMGVIKLSFDQDVRRQIATKIIHPTSKEIPSKQERFLEEAQITGQLEHPNIVPVHDLGLENDGNLFFTIKLVKGKSLLEVIELVANRKDGYHKYFTVTRFLQIFMKICDAVAFAHSKGVLHRDIKPENIMIGDYGEVMVMDWGLAKVKGLPDKRIDQVSTDRSLGKIHQTLDGSIVGTPGYMAPEQARGNLDDITEQSDIYSLGAILYEILSFKQAFP